MTTTPTHLTEDVLVIGAGPAGIATAYALQQANIRYKVIDRETIIGSTWDRLYPSLELNTSRFYSHMPQKPFPLEYGLFPSARQYHDYLLDFVRDHDFNIQLGVDVRRVCRDEGGLWRVETSAGVWLVPVVVSATGIFNNPILPDIPGMDDFDGELYHSHDFRDPAQVAGKRVVVVGNGPSGVDIAVASGQTAAKTYIAMRSGIQLKRRYPYGLPTHGWLLLGERLPASWCRWLMKRVGKLEYPTAKQYGLLPPPPGSGGMTAYAGPELLNAVKGGKVQPVVGPQQILPQGVRLTDGREIAADVLIMATGYEPVLHQYMDVPFQFNEEPWQAQSICDWRIGPNGQRGWPLRDTSTHPNGREVLGQPGLYLVGTFYKGKGAMYNFNIEAAIAAQQIRASLQKQRIMQQTMPIQAENPSRP